MRDNWRDQLGNVFTGILAIGIGVDDDVCASGQRRINAALECSCKTAVAAVMDDVVYPEPARDIGGAIVAAIVNHQHFDNVHPGQAPGQGNQRVRQAFSLVETRDLDDQLRHLCPTFGEVLLSMTV